MSELQTLRVDPEYGEFVAKTSQDEDDELDQSIIDHGLFNPITRNSKNIILDGHRRFRSCQRIGYDLKDSDTVTKDFETKSEEIIFVGEINLQRRQLTTLQRIQLVAKLEPYYLELAKNNSLSNLKQNTEVIILPPRGKTRDILGKKANVSGSTYEKGKKILTTAPTEIKEKTLADKNTIDKAYREIRKKEKREKRHEEIKKIQVNLPKTIQLHNKPFQELTIKDNSISLIFTDPPYTKEFLHLYDELAKQAIRVLRDGGSLMCYSGHYCIDVVIDFMKKHGLKFHWIIPVLHSGASALMFDRKIMVSYKPLLWFTKGKYSGNYVKDVIKSEFQGKELHEWAQSTIESDYYIKHTTIPNDIIYDPFMGQGTFGISARKLDRQFIGAEINKEHYFTAQKLISAKHSEIKTKKHDRKKYNTNYKNTNRKNLNKKEAQRMKEKRDFIKKIKPLFESEKNSSESFTEFYSRKRKEMDRGITQ